MVGADEAFEDAFPVRWRDAGAVVGDSDVCASVGLVDVDGDGAVGVSFGVVDEVAQGAGELAVITGDLDGGDAGEVEGDSFVVAEVAGLVVDEVVEVDGVLAAGHAVFVVTGEFEQVGDEVLEVVDVLEDSLVGGEELLRFGVGAEVDFEVSSHASEGAAEFV